MVNLDIARKELEQKKFEREQNLKKIKRLTELSKMPWIRRMQEPENKERLKQLEIYQEEAWHAKMKEKHPEEYEKELKNLFGVFFTDLLNEKCKNMIEWYEQWKNNKNQFLSNLKIQHKLA